MVSPLKSTSQETLKKIQYCISTLGICAGYADEFYTPNWDPLFLSRQMFFLVLDFRAAIIVAPMLPPFVMQVLSIT